MSTDGTLCRWSDVRHALSLVTTAGLIVSGVAVGRLLTERRALLSQIDAERRQRRPTVLADPLTGLPGRTEFGNIISKTISGAQGQPITIAVLRPTRTQLLDNLGAQDSDAAISELAVRISSCLRPDYRLARTAETTFAVLIPGDEDLAASFVRDVLVAMEAPIHAPHRRLHLTLASGIAALREGESDGVEALPAALIQQATIAFNTVATVPAGIAIFTPKMLREHAARLDLGQAVIHTLHDDPASNITVTFEPVVDLDSGRLVGLASRADWHDPDHGPLTAGHLAALAREAGLTERVDEVVLRTAISVFGGWARRWPAVCQQLWVTICTESLADPSFSSHLGRLLARAQVPPPALVLDPITPTGKLDNNALRTTLKNLRKQGVRIAASDAMALANHSIATTGEGRADCFDISPILVERCVDDLRARHIVRATVEFATTQHAVTAARQVTTVDQHEELRQLGCTFARGPLYGVPAPPEATENLVSQAASGAWLTPVGQEVKRRRSSQAWEELRQIISDLPIIAFACSPEGVLILAEGALLDQLGIASEVLDQPLTIMFDNPTLEEPLHQALRGVATAHTVRSKDHWLQVHLCPRQGRDDTVTGVLGVAIDVTHRIQAEQALRVSEARFREVFTQAQVGMIILTPQGRVSQANPAFGRMVGRSPDEVMGQHISELLHEDSNSGAIEQYESLKAGKLPGYLAECAYRHADGSPIWTRITVGLLADASLPGTVLAIVEDLRRVKQLEIELRHAQKLESVGMLAAGIAHEINTPIQFIGDNINFLAEAFTQVTRVLRATYRFVPAIEDHRARQLAAVIGEVDLPWLLEEVPEAARQSLEGVARVATIVKAMRNFGHPDHREPSPIDINGAIRDTATIARNEHKYVADLQLDLGLIPPVLGYPSEFHQVVLNLIVNAAHAVADAIAAAPAPADDREPRGTILVRSWADDTMAHISVTDNGCGMTPEIREHIFDPFFTTKEVGRGTGQGLTIVYNVVVEKHHGAIDVESAPGKGTVFTVHLPLSPTLGRSVQNTDVSRVA